jgi:hypothetical protein
MSELHDDDCICEAEAKKVKKVKKEKSVLQKSIYDKTVLSPATLEKQKQIKSVLAGEQPKGVVSKCPGVQPFKLEDMEIEKVLVEYRIKDTKLVNKSSDKPRVTSTKPMETPKRLTTCEALKLAGFGSDWTKEKVSKMLKTPDGSQLLERVNEEYKQLTGKSVLSEKDIISCYPNYLKKSRRNVELVVQLDGDENIVSVSDKTKKPKKSKFEIE